ncbi:hypothetical protein DRN73_05240 [Candidatus Pacearchaeota archaeon]|nr:MAG: hypothetical protein DRN73_05240 [Candidatus Pacearchaeota archaeon]
MKVTLENLLKVSQELERELMSIKTSFQIPQDFIHEIEKALQKQSRIILDLATLNSIFEKSYKTISSWKVRIMERSPNLKLKTTMGKFLIIEKK